MAEIKTVSIKHEAIMDYLIANPAEKLGAVAVHFRVSQAWLSTIIHSDAFQMKLREKSQDVFDMTIVPLREKLLGLAHTGVEKLGTALENASPVSDKEFIADTTDQILKNLGYSPKGGPAVPQTNVQQNFFTVDKESLEAARATMRAPQEQVSVIEGELIEQKQGSATEKF